MFELTDAGGCEALDLGFLKFAGAGACKATGAELFEFVGADGRETFCWGFPKFAGLGNNGSCNCDNCFGFFHLFLFEGIFVVRLYEPDEETEFVRGCGFCEETDDCRFGESLDAVLFELCFCSNSGILLLLDFFEKKPLKEEKNGAPPLLISFFFLD